MFFSHKTNLNFTSIISLTPKSYTICLKHVKLTIDTHMIGSSNIGFICLHLYALYKYIQHIHESICIFTELKYNVSIYNYVRYKQFSQSKTIFSIET